MGWQEHKKNCEILMESLKNNLSPEEFSKIKKEQEDFERLMNDAKLLKDIKDERAPQKFPR